MGGLAEDLEQGLTGTNTLGDRATRSTSPGATPRRRMKNFKGLAVAVRFDDGALEVEAAGDSGLNLPGSPAPTEAATWSRPCPPTRPPRSASASRRAG